MEFIHLGDNEGSVNDLPVDWIQQHPCMPTEVGNCNSSEEYRNLEDLSMGVVRLFQGIPPCLSCRHRIFPSALGSPGVFEGAIEEACLNNIDPVLLQLKNYLEVEEERAVGEDEISDDNAATPSDSGSDSDVPLIFTSARLLHGVRMLSDSAFNASLGHLVPVAQGPTKLLTKRGATKGRKIRRTRKKVLGNRFACQYEGCSLSFKRKYDCKRHMQSVHSAVRFYCEISTCERTFKRRDHLRNHIRNIHSTKPRKCKARSPKKKAI